MDINTTGGLLKRSTRRFDQIMNAGLLAHKLTASQFKTLKFIQSRPKGTVRQIDIEEFFGMTNPTITGIIKNLEKKGLIERYLHPDDRRCKIVQIAEEAGKLLSIYREFDEAAERKLTENLNQTERRQLRCLLFKLLGEEEANV
ncbi:MAG: MarR family transcriptional regulator [Lachnospiraceae bacterium]|nr:MarR family transcriptional regulator [Lachnospiraceae bacterium]MDY5742084.1 MarR family transcriptional regulator [Lachnospiraceae bacterium]